MATQGKPGLGERLRRPSSNSPEEARREEDSAPTRAARPARKFGREQLYADIGGALIGLGGAAALLNFVLLK